MSYSEAFCNEAQACSALCQQQQQQQQLNHQLIRPPPVLQQHQHQQPPQPISVPVSVLDSTVTMESACSSYLSTPTSEDWQSVYATVSCPISPCLPMPSSSSSSTLVKYEPGTCCNCQIMPCMETLASSPRPGPHSGHSSVAVVGPPPPPLQSSPPPTTASSTSVTDFTPTFYNPFEIKHRRRTSRDQFKVLEKTFLDNPKPNATVRRWLAQKLSMTPRGVQVWFQNRRAKAKTQRQQQQNQQPPPHSKPRSPMMLAPKSGMHSPQSIGSMVSDHTKIGSSTDKDQTDPTHQSLVSVNVGNDSASQLENAIQGLQTPQTPHHPFLLAHHATQSLDTVVRLDDQHSLPSNQPPTMWFSEPGVQVLESYDSRGWENGTGLASTGMLGPAWSWMNSRPYYNVEDWIQTLPCQVKQGDTAYPMPDPTPNLISVPNYIMTNVEERRRANSATLPINMIPQYEQTMRRLSEPIYCQDYYEDARLIERQNNHWMAAAMPKL
ncbi:uncharacterized protein BYT42DRAFT_614671 [Radiomyces spectabilis]|uniref:uncharacterized protein n=1 Tax=Radiomyces spectabilis TaxID=64574 RepID=UPI0022210B27|nr:uncharacterized protein BYT42DRAFT_614671 [Radiomyces spectabilis]KAI8378043.1 hypothetical protein BYT42DRAFT_614671 [Radiomyces spectabilis]